MQFFLINHTLTNVCLYVKLKLTFLTTFLSLSKVVEQNKLHIIYKFQDPKLST